MYKILSRNLELPAKWRQYLVAILLGPISFGVCISWTSPVLPQLQNNYFTLPVTLTVSDGSWVASMLTVGVLCSSILVGYLGDRFGPKKSMTWSVISTIVFTVIVLLAKDVYALCAARFVAGLSVASFNAFTPSYLIEISDTSRKGVVASFLELLIYGGVLLTSVFGAYFQYKTLTVMYCVFTVVISIALSFFPESPLYLLKRNQRQEAVHALKFFRSKSFNIEESISHMENSLNSETKFDVRNAFKSKGLRRGLIASFGLALFQRLTGFDSITFYNLQICQAADTGIDIYILSIILSTTQCISHVSIIILVEKAPRRLLMTCSCVICGVSLFALAAYFHMKQYDYQFYGMNYMPVICLSTIILGYGFGIGPIPWLLLGELFPANFKCLAPSLSAIVSWGGFFFISKVFPLILDTTPHYPFYFYGFCMILCVFFIRFFVPETRGKSLEEIQKELNS